MKAIIFDCDGTLVDSEMGHFTAWCHALKKHDYPFNVEDYFPYVGSPIENTSHLLAQKIGKDCAAELKREKHAFYRSSIEQQVLPIADTLAFLHRLVEAQKRFKYKLAIASGAPREEITIYLRQLKIDSFFDLVLSGKDDLQHYNDPEGVNKPKPYIYLEAAKRLGLSPKECVAIEDSSTGVLSSVRAGCRTVAIPNSFSQNHDFSAAHLLIPSLNGYTVQQFLDAFV